MGSSSKDLFEVALQHTDIVMQPRQSNTWGALSLDHMYEFMGGLNLSVRNVTGKDPEAYLSDYRNRHNVRMQTCGSDRSRKPYHPAQSGIYQGKDEGEETTAENFSKTFRNTYGWNVMKPSTIDHELWDDLYKMYILTNNNWAFISSLRTQARPLCRR